MKDPLTLFLMYDTWKILAGAFAGVIGKTLWDHFVKRQRIRDMVAREIRAQLEQRE